MQLATFFANPARPAAPVAEPGAWPSCAKKRRAGRIAGSHAAPGGRYRIDTHPGIQQDRQDSAGPKVPAREDRGVRP